MQTDMMGYRTRPRAFDRLQAALTRLGFPGGPGQGYPMASIGPTAGMTPGWMPMMSPGGVGMHGMMGMAGMHGMMGFDEQPGIWFAIDGQQPVMLWPGQHP